MKKRAEISSTALAIAVATLLCAPIFARAQSSSTTATSSAKAAAKTAGKTSANPADKTQNWVMPRIADGHPDVVKRLALKLEERRQSAIAAALPANAPTKMNPEEMRRLRSLGYIQ